MQKNYCKEITAKKALTITHADFSVPILDTNVEVI